MYTHLKNPNLCPKVYKVLVRTELRVLFHCILSRESWNTENCPREGFLPPLLSDLSNALLQTSYIPFILTPNSAQISQVQKQSSVLILYHSLLYVLGQDLLLNLEPHQLASLAIPKRRQSPPQPQDHRHKSPCLTMLLLVLFWIWAP